MTLFDLKSDEDKYIKLIIVHPKHIFYGTYTFIVMPWDEVGCHGVISSTGLVKWRTPPVKWRSLLFGETKALYFLFSVKVAELRLITLLHASIRANYGLINMHLQRRCVLFIRLSMKQFSCLKNYV